MTTQHYAMRDDAHRRGHSRGHHRSRNSKRKKFSEHLSEEAQEAMKLAYQDTLDLKSQAEESFRDIPSDLESSVTLSRISFKAGDTTSSNSTCDSTDRVHKVPQPPASTAPSFSDLYERNKSARMCRDITDAAFDESRGARRPLGGGAKLESAYEIVEVVNYDKPSDNWNEGAMADLAKLNSMDKCLVWMQAIDTPDNSGLTD